MIECVVFQREGEKFRSLGNPTVLVEGGKRFPCHETVCDPRQVEESLRLLEKNYPGSEAKVVKGRGEEYYIFLHTPQD